MKRRGRDGQVLGVVGLLILSLVLSAGCTSLSLQPAPGNPAGPAEPAGPGGSADTAVTWRDTPLTDLQGKGIFTIRDLAAEPVLVPVVSDSCPPCIIQLEVQLNEIDRLHTLRNGSIAVVALDLDLTPGPGFIARYHKGFGFTGYTARSPDNLTLELYHRFGPFAIDPGQIPVILVCPDGHDLLLPSGIKTAEDLTTRIGDAC